MSQSSSNVEAPLASFKLVQDPQHNARLIQLPAEIRSMIYRLLFTRTEPLYSKAEIRDCDTPVASYEKHTSLSSQAFRTCQHLYVEGASIMYEANTLRLYCGARSCHILDFSFVTPGYLEDIPAKGFTLLNYARHGGYVNIDPDLSKSESTGRSLYNMYPALARFTQIHLLATHALVYLDDSEEFAAQCRFLRDLLLNKCVTLFPRGGDKELMGQEYSSMLQVCRFLRCKTFRIRGPYKDGAFDDIVDEVTSDRPVFDTLQAVQKLKRSLRESDQPIPDYDDYVNAGDLDRPAISYDLTCFNAVKDSFKEKYTTWLKEDMDLEETRLKERRVKLEKQLSDAFDCEVVTYHTSLDKV
ncbi:hypothetical protein OHC33_001579 [Knufia fluminis]|uniref:Uncharacterized protein n=1 Tax=Knufia fluminis TaxID=191047 RepID=A0AAN8F5Q4_9EURO|nr:hypothetical protein OHC33_001579 [Knufia fluminis]